MLTLGLAVHGESVLFQLGVGPFPQPPSELPAMATRTNVPVPPTAIAVRPDPRPMAIPVNRSATPRPNGAAVRTGRHEERR